MDRGKLFFRCVGAAAGFSFAAALCGVNGTEPAISIWFMTFGACVGFLVISGITAGIPGD